MQVDDSAGIPNTHYVDHLVAAARSCDVRASENIVASGGVMLLAKGARVDDHVRERLLMHKLRRPLEDCVHVDNGVIPGHFGMVAAGLLEKHPLLRAICVPLCAQPPGDLLLQLKLSLPLRSLLTVHAQLQEERLNHAVGVAMLSVALASRLFPDDRDRQRWLAIAGLAHDVGELYIDPACLRRSSDIDASQWRQIVAHPLLGSLVLRHMEGAGNVVADAVLHHHERLDGFGYPRGVGGAALDIDGQIVAVSEWLIALIESGPLPVLHASMAMRLVPGEFGAGLLDIVSSAARAAPEANLELPWVAPLQHAVPRIVQLAATLARFQDSKAWIESHLVDASASLHQALMSGLNRMTRVQTSFSSAGLDVHDPESLLNELAALNDRHVYAEIMILVSELEWRLREVEREQALRASLLEAPDGAVIREALRRLRGAAAAPAAETDADVDADPD